MVREYLKIMTYNARSVKKKIIQIYDFMSRRRVDIALIQETFLKDKDSVRKDGRYDVYRLDRDDGRTGGGVMMIVRRGVRHELLPVPTTEVLETFAVEIITENDKFMLAVVYNPNPAGSSAALRRDITKLMTSSPFYVICGDMNARHSFWGCTRANQAGQVIYDLMMNYDLQVHAPPGPTYIPEDANRQPSTIDILLASGGLNITEIETDDDLNVSDHLPVLFTIGEMVDQPENSSSFKNYKDADWRLYADHINAELRLPSNGGDAFVDQQTLDDSIGHLSELIAEAEAVAVPRQRAGKHYLIPDQALRRLYAERRAIRRRYRRTYDPSLRDDVLRISQQIENYEQQRINSRFQDSLNNINNNDSMHKKLYKLTRVLRRKNTTIPTLRVEGRRLMSDREKAEALSEEINKAHRLTHSTAVRSRLDREVRLTNRSLDAEVVDHQEIKLFSVRKVRQAIKVLKNGKAPGIDGISNTLLRHLPNKAIVMLTYIFNGCLRAAYFPQAWKIAKILCFKKPDKDGKDPKNYRPISLLSALGKLLERLILEQLNEYTEEHEILNDEQFGFRRGHNCIHQVLRFTRLIKSSWTRRRSTAVVTLDIERAFDTVWHDGVVHKMVEYGYPRYLCKIVRSFLDQRQFHVSVGCERSSTHEIVAGVPQGSALSPLLYSIYTSDIPKDRECDLGQYADDTAVSVTGLKANAMIKRLERYLRRLTRYFSRWRVKINPLKTEAIWFTRRRLQRYLPERAVALDGDQIEWKDTVRYLGVHIDKRMTFGPHVLQVLKKTHSLIKTLYPLIGRGSRLLERNKLLLFKQIFRPTITYAAPLLNEIAMTHQRKLQIAQSKILKIILGVPMRTPTDEIHDITGIERLNVFTARLHEAFIRRIPHVNNLLVAQLQP